MWTGLCNLLCVCVWECCFIISVSNLSFLFHVLCELVGRRLCASSYVVKYAVGVLTFVSNLLDLSPLNGLLISCINQVNCEHICSVHASAHAPVCLYIHLQPTNLLSLFLYALGVCALGWWAERGEEVEETPRGMWGGFVGAGTRLGRQENRHKRQQQCPGEEETASRPGESTKILKLLPLTLYTGHLMHIILKNGA